jgi:hypothetical protein
MPGVEAAGAAASLPAGRRLGSHEFWRSRGTTGLMLGIGSTFFQALGTPVRAGREFLDHEIDAPPLVAILSESAARHLWPDLGGSEAVGQTVPTADGVRTVVGVVADLKSLPGEAPQPALYLPLTAPEMADSVPSLWVTVAVRVAPGRDLDIQALNARLDRRFGSDLVMARAVADALPPFLQRPRFQAVLFGSVAVIGLLLAAVGLYAVAAFDVARRRFELGVRLSLGATASDIRRLVIRGALRPVVAGSAAGLVATWWAAQFLQAFVFEVDARDPWTYGLVALVLVATAVVAAWIPARRAARTDPSVVLRAT